MTDTATGQGNACVVRTFELAEAQCTDGELRMTLMLEHFNGDLAATLKFLHPMEEMLDGYRMKGRASIRIKIYKLASGDVEMGKELTRTNVAAMDMFGRQHLGYTGEGMDSRVRKAVEKSERQMRGLKVVG